VLNIRELVARFGGVKPIDGDDFTPMSEAELAAIETDLSGRLPESYRQFLTNFGASAPTEIVMFNPVNRLPPTVSTSGKGHVSIFYGTKSEIDDAYGLGRRMKYFAGRIPPNLIPIGDNGMGNQVLLGIRGSESGKVFYWEQDNEPLDEAEYLEEYGKPRPPEAMFENVHLIADSFEDFLGRLEVSDHS